MESIILQTKHQVVNSIKLTKYLTKIQTKIIEIVFGGNMYTKMNFFCTKLRKMSTKGQKKQVIISEVVVVI